MFATAVAGFGMLLWRSARRRDLTLDQVLALARESTGEDPEGYRADLVRLVSATKELGLLE